MGQLDIRDLHIVLKIQPLLVGGCALCKPIGFTGLFAQCWVGKVFKITIGRTQHGDVLNLLITGTRHKRQCFFVVIQGATGLRIEMNGGRPAARHGQGVTANPRPFSPEHALAQVLGQLHGF